VCVLWDVSGGGGGGVAPENRLTRGLFQFAPSGPECHQLGNKRQSVNGSGSDFCSVLRAFLFTGGWGCLFQCEPVIKGVPTK
jgi:hypothetical protein